MYNLLAENDFNLSAINPSSQIMPKILAVGTGLSPTSYTQQEVLDIFRIKNSKIRSLFLNSSIDRRHLSLPLSGHDEIPRVETQGELIRKHVDVGIAMGRDAIKRCLEQAGKHYSEIRYLCCVSSTGFITPGFSALLIKDLGLRNDCARLDIVGMGCNAGLNGLSAVSAWTNSHPGSLALLVCIEVCSAAYVFDGTLRTAVVNSLFGDGSAALAVMTDDKKKFQKEKQLSPRIPSILRFSSYIIPDEIAAMRYDWDDAENKFSFFLDPQIPYLIGSHSEAALTALLKDTHIRQPDVSHWLIHSGGKKVIDSVRINLGLTQHDVRHTVSVLRNYGNMSSGSFLFSYEQLIHENVINNGDYGVMMTMGPGSTIEMALIYWT